VHVVVAALALALPAGWHTILPRLTSCTNPVERVDVVGPGRALVVLQEALDEYAGGFPRRPAHFAVHGPPGSLTCCEAPGYGKGWMLPFRDRGRSFYAWVYPGREHRAREALAILDGLRVTR